MASLSLLSPRFRQKLARPQFYGQDCTPHKRSHSLRRFIRAKTQPTSARRHAACSRTDGRGDDATLMVLRFGESDDSTIRIDLRPRDWGQPPPRPPGQDSSGFSGGRCSRIQHIDPQPDENKRRGPMAPPINRAQNKRMASEPSSDKTPERNQYSVRDQDQPQVRPADDKERHVYADVVGPVGQSHQSNGGNALRAGAWFLRIRSARPQQVLDSYHERQHPEKMNPAMRYCQSTPGA